MSNYVLSFEGHQKRSFPDFGWRRVETWRYALNEATIPDHEILSAMLADEHYAYSFIAPYPVAPKRGPKLRGPYYLNKLGPDSFFPVTSEQAWAELDAFLASWDPPANRSTLGLDDLLDGVLDSADAVYQLQDDETISHPLSVVLSDWGELVAIDRSAGIVLDIARGSD